jgi:hypothetical protein
MVGPERSYCAFPGRVYLCGFNATVGAIAPYCAHALAWSERDTFAALNRHNQDFLFR